MLDPLIIDFGSLPSVSLSDRNRANPKAYGETKKKYQIMLTEEASDLLQSRADGCSVTRSEFVERLLRWADEHWDGQLQRDLSNETEGDRNED